MSREKIELLNQTLCYLSDSLEDEEIIVENLEELEGDYYTFLNPQYTLELMNERQINSLQKSGLDFLYEIIKSISPSLWNPHSFKTSPIWKQAITVSEIIKTHFKK